jgi:hypothetical protein
MRRVYLPGFLLILIILTACYSENDKYQFERSNLTSQQRDTLLVDMVTLIGKKPKTADYINRHEPRFREYYKELSKNFQ